MNYLVKLVKAEVGHAIDLGCNPRKRNQEDCVLYQFFAAESPLGIFILNDGIGGENAGETAAKLGAFSALKQASTLFSEKDWSFEVVEKVIKQSLNNAHSLVFSEAESNEEYKGMGTTSTILCFNGNQVFWSWCGNSRIYRLSDSGLELLTRDHDEFSTLKEAEIYEESDKFTTLKGVMGQFGLMQALGDPDTKNPEASKKLNLAVKGEELPAGRFLYIFCSDGLHDALPDSSQDIPDGKYEKGILEIAWPFIEEKITPGEVAQLLVAEAIRLEAQDNVSVLVLSLEIKALEEPVAKEPDKTERKVFSLPVKEESLDDI